MGVDNIFRYGLGDCSQPVEETASLIEEITYDQLRTLVGSN